MKTYALICAYNEEGTIADIIERTLIHVDRIILFSDMQCYTDGQVSMFSRTSTEMPQLFTKYLLTINKNCKFYSMDLSGYGTVQADDRNYQSIRC